MKLLMQSGLGGGVLVSHCACSAVLPGMCQVWPREGVSSWTVSKEREMPHPRGRLRAILWSCSILLYLHRHRRQSAANRHMNEKERFDVISHWDLWGHLLTQHNFGLS